MRTREVAGEAWRNIVSGASKPLILLCLFTLTLLLGVSFSSQLVATAMQQYAAFEAVGAATTIIKAPGAVDGRRCVALSNVRGVTAAFALRQTSEEIRVAALPRFGQPGYEVYGDFVQLLGGTEAGTPGPFLSEAFARQLGVVAGSPFALRDATTRVAAVFEYPDDGRPQLLANAVVTPVPEPSSPFDECWVKVWPPDERLAALFDTVVSAGDESADAEFQLLNGTVGEPIPLADLLSTAHVTGVKIVGATAALVLGIVWIRIRRLDLSLALHLGQSRRAQLGQVLLEVVGIACLATAMVGVGTVLMISTRLPPAETSQIAASIVLTSVATVACLLAGVAAAHTTIGAAKVGDWSKDR